MSTTTRRRIVEAATQLVQARGLTPITFAEVAAATGLTRGGVNYHFPTRESLLTAVYENLAMTWDREIDKNIRALGGEPSAEDKVEAFFTVHARPPASAALHLLLEVRDNDELNATWQREQARWAPPPAAEDEAAVRRFTARLAAHGLWLYQALTHDALTAEQLAAVQASITTDLRPAVDDPGKSVSPGSASST